MTRITWILLWCVGISGCAPLVHKHTDTERTIAYQACELHYVQLYVQYEQQSKNKLRPPNPYVGPSNCYSVHFGSSDTTTSDTSDHWVDGHYRNGGYVHSYVNKHGTLVSGHYRKGGYVKGHSRK